MLTIAHVDTFFLHLPTSVISWYLSDLACDDGVITLRPPRLILLVYPKTSIMIDHIANYSNSKMAHGHLTAVSYLLSDTGLLQAHP